jgi:hypothetical protein
MGIFVSTFDFAKLTFFLFFFSGLLTVPEKDGTPLLLP